MAEYDLVSKRKNPVLTVDAPDSPIMKQFSEKENARQFNEVSHIAYVVSSESRIRAATAKMIFECGHHAEVYSDAKELLSHRPMGGIVLAHESKAYDVAKLCGELSSQGLWLPVIGFGLEVDVERAVAGMKAGALDFLVGEISPKAIVEKLDQCAAEANAQARFRNRKAAATLMVAKLSKRELEVLDRLLMGMSNKEIARDLEISPRTVEIHRMKMMGKLDSKSLAQAVCIRRDSLA